VNKTLLVLLVLLVIAVVGYVGQSYVFMMFTTYDGSVVTTSAIKPNSDNPNQSGILIMNDQETRFVATTKGAAARIKPGEYVRKGLFRISPTVTKAKSQ
jgi:cell division protein YceG involved in septum cleavage